MAPPVSDSGAAASRLRAAQRGLARLLARDVRALRRLIDVSRLQVSVPSWIEAVQVVVDRYTQTSASLAADFYDAERVAARAPGTFTVPLPDPPPQVQVENSLRWATKDLWPRDPSQATPAQLQPIDVRLEQAEQKAEGAVQRLVLDVSRTAVQDAVRRDRSAVAWARGAALGACSFCKLMATRGAVYASADTAGRDANARFQGDGEAKYHDHCNCVIIPIFRGQRFELSPHAREWDRLYQEYAQGHPGEQLKLFRRALAEHGQQLPTS